MTTNKFLTYQDNGRQTVRVLHESQGTTLWSPIHWDARNEPEATPLKKADMASLRRWNITQALMGKGLALVDPQLGASQYYPRIARNNPEDSVLALRARNWHVDAEPDTWRSANVALAHLSDLPGFRGPFQSGKLPLAGLKLRARVSA